MKKFQKLLAAILSVTLCLNAFVVPVLADSPVSSAFSFENASEFIEIDGVNYKFDYSMDSNTRIVTVTNLSTAEVDIVAYNPSESTIYLNDSVLAKITDDSSISYTSEARAGWTDISSSSHYISWKQGTSVAIVAAALATFLGSLGTAGVIAAMGTAALGTLAASASGGTLYLTLQEYYVPLATPQYRYEWSFRASTGDYYGPYYYHVFF